MNDGAPGGGRGEGVLPSDQAGALPGVSAVAVETAAKSATPSRWVTYALAACGLAILVLFVASTNIRDVGRALGGIRPALLGAAVLGIAAQILVRAVRWRYMIRELTGTAISGRLAAVSIVCGVAAGSLTPGRSFEVAKPLLLRAAHGVRLDLSMSAMIVERILDISLLIAALLAAALLLPRQMVLASAPLLVLIGAVLAGVALLVSVPLRLRDWVTKALLAVPLPEGLRRRGLRLTDTLCTSFLLWRQGHTVGRLLGLSGLIVLLDVTRVSTVLWSLGVPLSAPFIVFTYVGAAILGIALLVPGGVGVTEVSQVGLISLLAPGAVLPAVAKSAVLVDRFLSYYLVTLLGGALLILYHRYQHVFH